MTKRDKKFQMLVEWIGGPMDGEQVEVDAEADFITYRFPMPSEDEEIQIEIPIDFRENGKPIIIWQPEFSRYQ